MTVSHIPSNAFKLGNGSLNNLGLIFIDGRSIKRIENNAFKYIPNLYSIIIINTSISYIPENAFALEIPSKDKLQKFEISLTNNPFIYPYVSNIALGAFLSFNRPTTINFRTWMNGEVEYNYLEEQIFLPFFMQNIENYLGFTFNLNCSDCRNKWIINNKYNINVRKQLISLLACNDGNKLGHSSHFRDCRNSDD